MVVWVGKPRASAHRSDLGPDPRRPALPGAAGAICRCRAGCGVHGILEARVSAGKPRSGQAGRTRGWAKMRHPSGVATSTQSSAGSRFRAAVQEEERKRVALGTDGSVIVELCRIRFDTKTSYLVRDEKLR